MRHAKPHKIDVTDSLVKENAMLDSMKWLEITTTILLDVIERLHRLHTWVLFPTFGVLVGAMIGVVVSSRTQSMILGAFLGLLAGIRVAQWYLKR